MLTKRDSLKLISQVQGFLQKLVGEKILFEASRARSHKVSPESWYNQSDPRKKDIKRIAEARKYYERIILNNIG